MDYKRFTIKDPEVFLEKLTSLKEKYSKLSTDRELKEIFHQIDHLQSGLALGTSDKENVGSFRSEVPVLANVTNKPEVAKIDEILKSPERDEKAKYEENLSDHSSDDILIIRKKPKASQPSEKKQTSAELTSESLNLQNLSKSKKAKYGESDLQLAIKSKDQTLIQQLIDAKLDINHRDNNKLTALHDAVSHKNVELAEKLINAGAQVNAFGGPSHSTPLHLAASYEDTDMVRLLLEYGADPYKKDGDGQEAFNITMQTKIQKIIKKAKEKFSQEKSEMSSDPSASMLDSSGVSLADVELPKVTKVFLHNRGKESLAKLKKTHGLTFVGDVAKSTHMVITASEAENYPMEYLRAMLTGKWIVSPLFLKTKSEIDTLLNVFNESPKRALLADYEQEPPLLTGMKIFFDRGLNANLKTRIASLVTTGGAKIINREPKPDSDAIQSDSSVILANADFQYTYIILYDGPKKSAVRRGKVASAPIDWLFKCIAHFQILPL